MGSGRSKHDSVVVTDEIAQDVKLLVGPRRLLREQLTAILGRSLATAINLAQAQQMEDCCNSVASVLVDNLDNGNYALLAENIALLTTDLFFNNFDAFAPSRVALERINMLKNAVLYFRLWTRAALDGTAPDNIVKVLNRGFLTVAPILCESGTVESVFESPDSTPSGGRMSSSTSPRAETSASTAGGGGGGRGGAARAADTVHSNAGNVSAAGQHQPTGPLAAGANHEALSTLPRRHNSEHSPSPPPSQPQQQKDADDFLRRQSAPSSAAAKSSNGTRTTPLARTLSSLMAIVARMDAVPCTRGLLSEAVRCLLVLMSFDARHLWENPFFAQLQCNPSEIAAFVTSLARLTYIHEPVEEENASLVSDLVSVFKSPWSVLSAAFTVSAPPSGASKPLPLAMESTQLLLALVYSHYQAQPNLCKQVVARLVDADSNNLFHVSFPSLYSSLCDASDHGILLLYTLLYNNGNFYAFVVSHTADLEQLLLPLLERLYGEERSDSYVVYIVVVTMLLLSQEPPFVEAMFALPCTQPLDWFSDRTLRGVSVGDVVVLVLLRIVQVNMSGERDEYVNDTCMAALCNMAPRVSRLHPYTSQRLVALFTMFTKHFIRLCRRHNQEIAGVEYDGSPIARNFGAVEGPHEELFAPVVAASATNADTQTSSTPSATAGPRPGESAGVISASSSTPGKRERYEGLTAGGITVHHGTAAANKRTNGAHDHQRGGGDTTPLLPPATVAAKLPHTATGPQSTPLFSSTTFSSSASTTTTTSAATSSTSSPQAIVALVKSIERLLASLLKVMTTILAVRLRQNVGLVYSVLVDKDVFFSLAEHVPSFVPLVSPVRTLVALIQVKFDPAHKAPSSVDAVMEAISSASQQLPDDRLVRPQMPRFQYEQTAAPWEFFLPYVWGCVLQEHAVLRSDIAYALFEDEETPEAS